jgi:formylglycine-generating enzyme
MGSNAGERDARPHPVAVSSFCIDTTEVTIDAYQACFLSKECPPMPSSVAWNEISESAFRKWSPLCNPRKRGRGTHPVNCIDWKSADAYCRAQGSRLPGEDEWEYAAKGGAENRTYPWGSAEPGPTLLNACDDDCVAAIERLGEGWNTMFDGSDGYATTAPVGSFPAGNSRDGVQDLGGNVTEWTASFDCPYPFGTPCTNTNRILRGAAWGYDGPRKAQTDFRYGSPDGSRTLNIGFRCAR